MQLLSSTRTSVCGTLAQPMAARPLSRPRVHTATLMLCYLPHLQLHPRLRMRSRTVTLAQHARRLCSHASSAVCLRARLERACRLPSVGALGSTLRQIRSCPGECGQKLTASRPSSGKESQQSRSFKAVADTPLAIHSAMPCQVVRGRAEPADRRPGVVLFSRLLQPAFAGHGSRDGNHPSRSCHLFASGRVIADFQPSDSGPEWQQGSFHEPGRTFFVVVVGAPCHRH